MKTIKPFLSIIGIFLIFSFLFSSCRVSKIAALRCPQVLTKKNNEVFAKYKRSRYTSFTSKYIPTIKKQSVGRLIIVSQKNRVKNIDAFKNSPIYKNVMVSGPEYLNGISKIEYTKRLTASIDEKVIPLRKNYPYNFQSEKSETPDQQADVIVIPTSGCDTIILKIGVKMPCKVVDIGQRKITLKNCYDATIPAISILKSDVSAIKFSNGKSVSLLSSSKKADSTDQQTNVNAIPSDKCDTILFKSGYRTIGKVMEIGKKNLTYRKWDDLSGSVYSILKSDVLEIRTFNGKQILVTSSDVSPYRTDDIKNPESLGIAGSFLSLVGLVLFAILIKEYFIAAIIIAFLSGVIGIVCGTISLIKILRHSDYHKGRFFAILSICIGAFDIVAVILSLIILLFIFFIIWAFSPKS
jgi:hypothetical protein